MSKDSNGMKHEITITKHSLYIIRYIVFLGGGAAGKVYFIWKLMVMKTWQKKSTSYINKILVQQYRLLWTGLYGPRHEKTFLWRFRQSETQTSPLSYKD